MPDEFAEAPRRLDQAGSKIYLFCAGTLAVMIFRVVHAMPMWMLDAGSIVLLGALAYQLLIADVEVRFAPHGSTPRHPAAMPTATATACGKKGCGTCGKTKAEPPAETKAEPKARGPKSI